MVRFSLPLDLPLAHCCPCVEEAAASMMPFEIEALGVPFSEASCQKGGRYLSQNQELNSLSLTLKKTVERGSNIATAPG